MVDFIKNPGRNFSTRDMLFGDLPLTYWASIDARGIPWDLFKEVKNHLESGDKNYAISILKEIIDIPGLESRQYLQAYHFLNGLGVSPVGATSIFGIVLEVNMPQGNDVLATYVDRSARYYNYSGKSVIWEHPDNSIDALVDGIFDISRKVITQIGPWKNERPKPPTNKMVRINFLTSNGLHFGEASQQTLFSDPLSGPLMYQMLKLMETLVDKSMQSPKK